MWISESIIGNTRFIATRAQWLDTPWFHMREIRIIQIIHKSKKYLIHRSKSIRHYRTRDVPKICQLLKSRMTSSKVYNRRVSKLKSGRVLVHDEEPLQTQLFLQSNILNVLGFSLNGAELWLNSENLRNHWILNWAQFKDPIRYPTFCQYGIISVSNKSDSGFKYSNPFNF